MIQLNGLLYKEDGKIYNFIFPSNYTIINNNYIAKGASGVIYKLYDNNDKKFYIAKILYSILNKKICKNKKINKYTYKDYENSVNEELERLQNINFINKITFRKEYVTYNNTHMWGLDEVSDDSYISSEKVRYIVSHIPVIIRQFIDGPTLETSIKYFFSDTSKGKIMRTQFIYLIEQLVSNKFLVLDFKPPNIMWIPNERWVIIDYSDTVYFNTKEETRRNIYNFFSFYYVINSYGKMRTHGRKRCMSTSNIIKLQKFINKISKNYKIV